MRFQFAISASYAAHPVPVSGCGAGMCPMMASFSASVRCGPLNCWACPWLLAAGWKRGCAIGPTEKLRNACPSAELGVCGGCRCCCCRTRCSSPSSRACLSCFSFSSSMSTGLMARTATQKVAQVSCALLTKALSVGGSCHQQPTTRRLLSSGITFASFSNLFAHAM